MTTEQIQELFETSDRLVGEVSIDFHRYLYNEIDWRDRLICIMGARGTGKTTLMRQHIREAFGVGSDKAVYISLDDLWFSQYGVKDAVGYLNDHGYTHVFIDEVHTIMGAGAAEGAVDAANILKPSLARGEIQVIGATTIDEYRKNIEKDAALERRFQPVTVGEPTEEETIEILKGLRDKYEAHHKVKITDEAIENAVKMSARYIADRFLPDKAIDLIDEAASVVRLNAQTIPQNLKDMESEIKRLEQEKQSAITSQDYENAAKYRDRQNKLKELLSGEKDKWRNASSHSYLSKSTISYRSLPMPSSFM